MTESTINSRLFTQGHAGMEARNGSHPDGGPVMVYTRNPIGDPAFPLR